MSFDPATERRLLSTTDARVWADEFARLHPGADVALLHTWFTAAIETGRDAGIRAVQGQRNQEESARYARILEGR